MKNLFIYIISVLNVNNNEISNINLRLYIKYLKLLGDIFKSIGQNEEHGNFIYKCLETIYYQMKKKCI